MNYIIFIYAVWWFQCPYYLQALVDHFLTHITQSACTTKVILKRGSKSKLNSYCLLNAHFQIRGQRRQGVILGEVLAREKGSNRGLFIGRSPFLVLNTSCIEAKLIVLDISHPREILVGYKLFYYSVLTTAKRMLKTLCKKRLSAWNSPQDQMWEEKDYLWSGQHRAPILWHKRLTLRLPKCSQWPGQSQKLQWEVGSFRAHRLIWMQGQWTSSQ